MMSISFDLAFNLLISYLCIFDGLAAAHSNAVWKKQRRETQGRRKPIQLSSSHQLFPFLSCKGYNKECVGCITHKETTWLQLMLHTFSILSATSKWAWVCAGCSPLPKIDTCLLVVVVVVVDETSAFCHPDEITLVLQFERHATSLFCWFNNPCICIGVESRQKHPGTDTCTCQWHHVVDPRLLPSPFGWFSLLVSKPSSLHRYTVSPSNLPS